MALCIYDAISNVDLELVRCDTWGDLEAMEGCAKCKRAIRELAGIRDVRLEVDLKHMGCEMSDVQVRYKAMFVFLIKDFRPFLS